jgi:transposase-like protein
MARPTKLTPKVIARICKAIRAGLSYKRAAQAAGVGESTLREWRAQGEADLEAEVESEFSAFLAQLQEAEAVGEEERALIISKSAKGGGRMTETRRVVKRVRIPPGKDRDDLDAFLDEVLDQPEAEEGDADGRLIIIEEKVTTTEYRTLPDWKAAAWIQERRHPQDWRRSEHRDLDVRSVAFTADEAAQAAREVQDWEQATFGGEADDE